MGLDVVIVGAGIAGLTVAVTLRLGGHNVEIYESSRFAAEVGAAVNLAPNGVLTLEHLGFDFKRAKTVPMEYWDSLDRRNLQEIAKQKTEDAAARFGAPYYSIHRVDLHHELMRLANVTTVNGPATQQIPDGKFCLHLSSAVEKVDASTETIEFADGTVRKADLIVDADGLHSVVRGAVIRDPNQTKAEATGLSAFRFLIQTSDMEATVVGKELLKAKVQGTTMIVDTEVTGKPRHITWYQCRAGEVQNFVGIHPTKENSNFGDNVKAQMMDEFKHFDPRIVEILSQGTEVKNWPLFSMRPLPTWSNGKAVIIGDAAHPMLPLGGKGSNQAFQDAGVLGLLFDGIHTPAQAQERLKLFDALRIRRVSRVQILSSTSAGHEFEVADQVRAYAGVAIPMDWAGRVAHDAGYGAIKRCKEALADLDKKAANVASEA